jgi:hypothetical protein
MKLTSSMTFQMHSLSCSSSDRGCTANEESTMQEVRGKRAEGVVSLPSYNNCDEWTHVSSRIEHIA